MPNNRLARMRARAASIVAAFVALVVLAGCGDDSAGTQVPQIQVIEVATEPEAAPALPVTVTDATGQQVTVTSIDRIIPVNGDLAEVVFALGLGDQVAATDLSATFPPEADAKPEIGYEDQYLYGFGPRIGQLLADLTRDIHSTTPNQ